MSPSIAALITAVFVTASPEPSEDRVASIGSLPAEQLQDVVVDALPPPPLTVVRETRYYGTVTIDHRAHLQRKAACKTCHGTGGITKLEFTPKVAHDRCIGCHQQQSKGPVNCQGCHVQRPNTPPLPQIAMNKEEEPCLPEQPLVAAQGPNPANLAAAIAAFDTKKRDEEENGVLGKEPFHRWLEVGLAAGEGQGVSVRVASHQNFIVVTQSVERLMSSNDARTLGLLGAGLSHPIHSRFSLEAVGLAGFDAIDRPLMAFLPAVGARAGIEWRTGIRFFNSVTASVTGVYDLSTRQVSDQEIGGTTVYGTIATGFKFSPR